MTCEYYQEAMSAFLDGQLDELVSRETFLHLSVCAPCRGFLRSSIVIQQGFRDLPIPSVPTSLDRRILHIPDRDQQRTRPLSVRIRSALSSRFDIPVPALVGGMGLLLITVSLSVWSLLNNGFAGRQPEQEVVYVVDIPPVEVVGVPPSSGGTQH